MHRYTFHPELTVNSFLTKIAHALYVWDVAHMPYLIQVREDEGAERGGSTIALDCTVSVLSHDYVVFKGQFVH